MDEEKIYEEIIKEENINQELNNEEMKDEELNRKVIEEIEQDTINKDVETTPYYSQTIKAPKKAGFNKFKAAFITVLVMFGGLCVGIGIGLAEPINKLLIKPTIEYVGEKFFNSKEEGQETEEIVFSFDDQKTVEVVSENMSVSTATKYESIIPEIAKSRTFCSIYKK